MNLKTRIVVDGNFINYGGTVLNRAEVSEADAENGMVIMKSGHQYWLSSVALKAWFSDTMDYSKLPESAAKDAPTRIYLLVKETRDASESDNSGIDDVQIRAFFSRQKAEEALEQDGAFIANLEGSTIKDSRYVGRDGDWLYDWFVTEMEVQ